MDDKLLVAIIAGSSALLGSLIPTLISYLNNKEQKKFELQKSLLELQKEIYGELVETLQAMVNNATSEKFLELQKIINKTSIYGDNSTSKVVNKYYNELVRGEMGQRNPLNKEEHKKFQQQIMNSMRSHIGLEQLNNFELIGFRPPKS